MNRRLFVASSLSAALAACGPIGNKLNASPRVHAVLNAAESIDERAFGTRGLVREYTQADISRDFPLNSLDTPEDELYVSLVTGRFRDYRLTLDGLVEHPQRLSLAHLQRLARVRQITRHDCVEGWSAIAQWRGARLSDVLALARPRSNARFAIFHSFDRDANGTSYYESLSLPQAAHPQTLLALEQNGKPVTPDRGAPVRLVVPTQLGYKSAKWVHRIELAASLPGSGGYWEDQGYEWYAGI